MNSVHQTLPAALPTVTASGPVPTGPQGTDYSGAVARVIYFFEHLGPEQVQDLGRIYAPAARFKDPFNDVTGVSAIERIFDHMFEALEQPRFVVTRSVVQGNHCFLTWEFHFGFKRFKTGETQLILGATHLEFSYDGRVVLHRDYWDAAEELYEKMPVVGGLMRWLKRRANQ